MKFEWKVKYIVGILIVAVISVIAVQGIIQAPSRSSDHTAEDLEKELEENQELLKEQTPAPEPERDFVTLVGDSVMLGAAPDLKEQIPQGIIDAEESRQVRDAITILQGLEDKGQLGNTVVIELGINSYFSLDTGQEVVDYLGNDRQIYWVSVYGRYLADQERINQVIRDLAQKNDNVTVIPWDVTASEHPDWFYHDGIHLNGAGRTGFATMIREQLGLELPDEGADTDEGGGAEGESGAVEGNGTADTNTAGEYVFYSMQ